MSTVSTVVVPSVIFLVLEGLHYLFLKQYGTKLLGPKSDSMNENPKVLGYIVHLAVELFALIYFVLAMFFTLGNAFIFGLVLKGFCASGNMAFQKDAKISWGVEMTAWKGVQFALTVYFLRFL